MDAVYPQNHTFHSQHLYDMARTWKLTLSLPPLTWVGFNSLRRPRGGEHRDEACPTHKAAARDAGDLTVPVDYTSSRLIIMIIRSRCHELRLSSCFQHAHVHSNHTQIAIKWPLSINKVLRGSKSQLNWEDCRPCTGASPRRVRETFELNQLKSVSSQLPVFSGFDRLQTCCH